jgi:uncharacterized membrane protein
MFLVSSLIGLVGEYLIGFIYYKVLNEKLWVYKRLTLNGYSSLLSMPLWGIGGVVFWFLSKLLGL